MTTWTKVTKASGTVWTKVTKPVVIGLWSVQTLPWQLTLPWQQSKISTVWTKVTKAT